MMREGDGGSCLPPPTTGMHGSTEQPAIDWPFPPLRAGHSRGGDGAQTGVNGEASRYRGEPTGTPPPSDSDAVSATGDSVAGLNPAATAFAPRNMHIASVTHGRNETNMTSASAARLSPAAVEFVPRGGVSSVGGPMCPDDHWYCTDGARAARQVRANADRYTYHCNVCLRYFDQRRPNLVRQDESHDPRWRDDIDRNTKMVTAPLLESPAEEPVASLLLLGPSGAGKSTLFNAGLTLGGERLPETSAGPPPPTRGLVRQLLVMPASAAQGDWLQRLLLCDAGGGRAEQRQWIELVREPEVGALVFVADVADDSEETLQLFKQLASSKWAKKVTEGEEEGRERHRNVGR